MPLLKGIICAFIKKGPSVPLLKGTICAFIKKDHLCPARKGLSVPNFKGPSVPEKVELLYLCFAGMAHV